MKKSAIRLVLLFSLSMNLAVVAAFAYQHSRKPAAAAVAADPFAVLELTPEQAEAFAQEKHHFSTYRGSCHGEMTNMRAALVAELIAAAPDQEAIDQTLAAMRERQSATERRLVDHLLALREILRPEQQASFAAVLERTLGGGCKSQGRECVHAIHQGR